MLCFFSSFCVFYNIIVLNFAESTSFFITCANVLILKQNLKISIPKATRVSLCSFFLAFRAQHYCFVIKSFCTNFGTNFCNLFFMFYFQIVQNLANSFTNVLYILLRILSISLFFCFVLFMSVLFLCIFVNLLHILKNIANLFYVFYHAQLVLILAKI